MEGTGIRSVYFCLMRSASAFLFSKGCSSLNLDFILLESDDAQNNETRERDHLSHTLGACSTIAAILLLSSN